MKNIWGREISFPSDVFYSPEYLWVSVESGNRLRIGISDLGVKSVKSLSYIEIEVSVGIQVKKGDRLGTIETSKRAWEIIAPVSGVVVALNSKTSKGNPATLASDPYGEGWIVELERTSETESELQELLKGDMAETKKWIQEQVEAFIPLLEES